MKKRLSLHTLYFIGFLFSLHTALIVYSNSSFLGQYIPEPMIGILYSVGSILTIIGLALIPKIVNRFGSRIAMAGILLVIIGICAANAFVKVPLPLEIIFCVLVAANTMFFLTNDILVDQVADSESMGKTRGSYLTILNVGYVIAPTITGFILSRMGFSALYGIAGILLIPLLLVVLRNPSTKHIHPSKVNIWKSLYAVSKNRDLRNIVGANFLLQFFYAWMVIYTPIFLHNQLLIPWDTIGTIFSIMLFAFVVTEIPLGRLADRIIGEKKILIVGFIIMGVSTSLLFFMPHFTLPLLALVLFSTRIGASCIEVMTESYFFKKVPKSETGEISIFRNTYPLAYIIAPLLAAPILHFLPPQYLYLILGIFCILGVFFIFPIHDVK